MSEHAETTPDNLPDALVDPEVDEVRDEEISDDEVSRSMPDAGTSDQDPASFLNP